MRAHVVTVAQQHVAHGTALHADVLLLHHAHEIGVHDQTKAMTDPLSA